MSARKEDSNPPPAWLVLGGYVALAATMVSMVMVGALLVIAVLPNVPITPHPYPISTEVVRLAGGMVMLTGGGSFLLDTRGEHRHRSAWLSGTGIALALNPWISALIFG